MLVPGPGEAAPQVVLAQMVRLWRRTARPAVDRARVCEVLTPARAGVASGTRGVEPSRDACHPAATSRGTGPPPRRPVMPLLDVKKISVSKGRNHSTVQLIHQSLRLVRC